MIKIIFFIQLILVYLFAFKIEIIEHNEKEKLHINKNDKIILNPINSIILKPISNKILYHINIKVLKSENKSTKNKLIKGDRKNH